MILSLPTSHPSQTARGYNAGRSEEILGQLQANNNFLIASKAPGFSPGSLTKDKVSENCKLSLKALAVDQMDLYYIHGPDNQTPIEETCRAFGDLYRKGAYKRFAVSNLNPEMVGRAHTACEEQDHPSPSVYQGVYSPINRNAELELIPTLKKLGMGFYAWGPLAGGLLAKPIEEIMNPDPTSRYGAMPVFRGMYLKPEILNGLEKLTATCQAHGISVLEGSLRWLLHHSILGEADGIILGGSTSTQLEASLKACQGGPLEEDLVQAFELLWEASKSSAPPAFFG